MSIIDSFKGYSRGKFGIVFVRGKTYILLYVHRLGKTSGCYIIYNYVLYFENIYIPTSHRTFENTGKIKRNVPT